jgi:uncharacterized protein (DUF1800 family)
MCLTRVDLSTRKALSRMILAGVLCVLLAGAPIVASGLSAKRNAQASAPQIEGRERILHALDRFTFGPRAEDFAMVQQMGLRAWFEQQLQPSSIDDTGLEQRLSSFPAMKLSQEELMRRFPSPQTLRATEKRDLPLPPDPVERAIYSDQLAFYKIAQAKKAAKGNDAAEPKMDASTAALPGDMLDPATPAMATHEEQLYSGLEAVKIINLPPDQRMSRILAMSPKELIAFYQSLSRRERAEAAAGLSPEQKELFAALPGSLRVVSGELLQSRLLRDVYSNRQLEAVMTDFWLNHFNIYIRKNQNEPYLLSSFERDVIRPNALGNFEDLLVATAKSPAMLMYLDNWQSIGPASIAAERVARRRLRSPDAKLKGASGLNENYARELMELHTLGVNGGYTQADVTQVAEVFTGWTINRPLEGAAYHFDEDRHEPGKKIVLGTEISGGGEAEGLQVLHKLASSPATAKFISTKLAVRFVSDDPPPLLVDRMTKSFLASHGDIKTVLRTMFDAPEFWSPSVYRAKVKTPLEFVVSSARATNAEITNAQPLVQALAKLGMPLYGMQTPNGYSWKAEPWVSTGALVSRLNFSLVLAGDHLPGVRTGLNQMLEPSGEPRVAKADGVPADKERRLELLLLGHPASERTRSTVLQQLQDSVAGQQAEKQFSIKASDPEEMAISLPGGKLYPSPEAQSAPEGVSDRQAGMMAGLLLGSPEFQRR